VDERQIALKSVFVALQTAADRKGKVIVHSVAALDRHTKQGDAV
jgi:hypothetical protein